MRKNSLRDGRRIRRSEPARIRSSGFRNHKASFQIRSSGRKKNEIARTRRKKSGHALNKSNRKELRDQILSEMSRKEKKSWDKLSARDQEKLFEKIENKVDRKLARRKQNRYIDRNTKSTGKPRGRGMSSNQTEKSLVFRRNISHNHITKKVGIFSVKMIPPEIIVGWKLVRHKCRCMEKHLQGEYLQNFVILLFLSESL